MMIIMFYSNYGRQQQETAFHRSSNDGMDKKNVSS
jgi:hypothetical protein